MIKRAILSYEDFELRGRTDYYYGEVGGAAQGRPRTRIIKSRNVYYNIVIERKYQVEADT